MSEGIKIVPESYDLLDSDIKKEGFEVVSDEFMEDGIPHVKMEKVIV